MFNSLPTSSDLQGYSTLNLLEDLERNVENITNIYNLHDAIKTQSPENKENISSAVASSNKVLSPTLVRKDSSMTESKPLPLKERVESKKLRRLSFKNSPIIHLYESTANSFDLNSSIDSSDIVSEFLSSKTAPSFQQFEVQVDQRTEGDNQTKVSMTESEAILRKKERSLQLKEKIKQLKIEQEKLIKQHETVQKLFNTDDEVEDADTDIEILEIEEEPATPSTPKQKSAGLFDRLRSPSSLIIRSVLNTKLDPVEQAGPIVVVNEQNRVHNNSILDQEEYSVGSNPSSNETIMQYLPYLVVSDPQKKLEALRNIVRVLDTEQHLPMIQKRSLVDSLVICLEGFDNQEDHFNRLVIIAFSKLGKYANPAAKLLLGLLKDPMRRQYFELAIESLLCIGVIGLKSLLSLCSEATSDFDSYILSHIANHQMIQQHVIIPTLIYECDSVEGDKRTAAVGALLKMQERAVGALSTLLNMLIAGSVSRKLVVRAIKNCGEEGERMLLYLSQNRNHRVRACVAYILGQKRVGTSSLKVIVSTDYSSMLTQPKIVFQRGDDESGDYLLLDARELISSINRGLAENAFDSMHEVGYRLDSSITHIIVNSLKVKSQSLAFGAPFVVDKSLDIIKTNLPLVCNSDHDHTDETVSQDSVNILSRECSKMLATMLSDPEESVKVAAAISIANIGLPDAEPAIDALIDGLSDQNNKIRAEILQSFSRIGTQLINSQASKLPNIMKTIAPLLKDSHWNVRAAAVSALTSFGTEVSTDKGVEKLCISLLLKLLKDGSVNRNEVAKCLISIGDKGVLQVMTLMRQETQTTAQVRKSTAYGLSLVDIKAPYIDKVIECLFLSARDRVPPVRRTVLAALGTLSQKDNNSITYLRPRSLLPFLYSFLKDRESCVREIAAEVIALSGPHGELLLIEGLLKDSNNVIRASAAYGLKFVGPRAIRTLLLALDDKDPKVSEAVCSAIESMEPVSIAEVLKTRPIQQCQSVIQSAKEIIAESIPISITLTTMLSKLVQELEKIVQQQ